MMMQAMLYNVIGGGMRREMGGGAGRGRGRGKGRRHTYYHSYSYFFKTDIQQKKSPWQDLWKLENLFKTMDLKSVCSSAI